MQVVSENAGASSIDGPAGRLEVQVEAPRAVDAGADLVVCHPHPLHGGSMDNKVVHTLVRAARDAGLRGVRFNFRGVGASAGTHDRGEGEVDDLLAVVDGVAVPGRRLLLAGFSFGAWIAAAGAARLLAAGRPAAGLLLVAPPVQYPGFATLPPLQPTVYIGTDDEIVDPDAVARWCRETQPDAVLQTFPAGHFFHGELPALKAATGEWLAATLSRRAPAQ